HLGCQMPADRPREGLLVPAQSPAEPGAVTWEADAAGRDARVPRTLPKPARPRAPTNTGYASTPCSGRSRPPRPPASDTRRAPLPWTAYISAPDTTSVASITETVP